MAFDPTAYKAPKAKKLPVILLLDVSGSMRGDKITSLYQATNEMIDCFVREECRETEIDVAIITFGEEITLHTPYTPAKELQKRGIAPFQPGGLTPLEQALQMAKDMIEDRNTTPSRIYRPAVLLVSDGEPEPREQKWEEAMDRFITEGRSSKCQRFAVAIGDSVNMDVLEKFAGQAVYHAQDASSIADCFEKFSMSVSTPAAAQTGPNVQRTENGESGQERPRHRGFM